MSKISFCKCKYGKPCGDTMFNIEQQLKDEYKQGAEAGFLEGGEQIIKYILALLEFAEQDKEMADDPKDPKVRIEWFKHRLLSIEINKLKPIKKP